MRRGLIPICLLTIAAATCGMTSKKATEMDQTSAVRSMSCCREATTDTGQPVAFPSDAKVDRHPATGAVVSVKGENLGRAMERLDCFRSLMDNHQHAEAALCFLDAFRTAFKLDHPSRELAPIGVHTDELKITRVRLHQRYADLVVWPCEISVYISAKNQVYWVKGNTIPTPHGLDTGARLSASQAIEAATRSVGIDMAGCSACAAELIVYAGQPQQPTLAYRVSAGKGLTDAWDVIVDANSGDILKKLSRVRTHIGS